MVLRFYPGGPRAIRGTSYWRTPNCSSGCWVARQMGASIPESTYTDADHHFSQWWVGCGGVNFTALLPIEE